MKKLFLVSLLLLAFGCTTGRDFKAIQLIRPEKTGGKTVTEALWNRQSTRTFGTGELSVRELSDLVWAAAGINRPDGGKRTSPTAMNAQDIDLYVCLPEGAYRYDPANHCLVPVTKGDHRGLVAGSQEFAAKAPVCLVLVSDLSKFRGDDRQQKMLTGAVDAGIVSQNISIYCASAGLATVPRMYMDKDGLRMALNLTELQEPMLNHPVGHFE